MQSVMGISFKGGSFAFTNLDEYFDKMPSCGNLSQKRYNLSVSEWNIQSMACYELLKNVGVGKALHYILFVMVKPMSKIG